jgi:hypothetical protein
MLYFKPSTQQNNPLSGFFGRVSYLWNKQEVMGSEGDHYVPFILESNKSIFSFGIFLLLTMGMDGNMYYVPQARVHGIRLNESTSLPYHLIMPHIIQT